MPETQDPPVKVDQEGLPVPSSNGHSDVQFDNDGLPVPVKKKEDSASSPFPGYPTHLQSDSSPTQTETGTSASKSDLHPDLFGKQKSNIPVNASDIVDDINKATNKPELATRKTELTNKFFNADLSAEDVDMIRGGAPDNQFQHGVSSNDIAGAINTKTKNLKTWSNIAVMKGTENYVSQLHDVDTQLTALKGLSSSIHTGQWDEQIKNLENQKAFLHHSMTQVYNAEKEKTVPKIITDLKNNVYGGKDWNQIIDETGTKTKEGLFGTSVFEGDKNPNHQEKYFVKYDDKKHTLTPESTASILKFTDDWANKNKNKVLQAGQFGGFPEGENNYSDLGKSVVDYLNTVPQIDRNIKKATDDFKSKNKKLAPLLDHQENIRNYFTPANNQATDAYVNTYQDKNFVIAQEKYSGKNGIITTNPEFVKIQHKWAEAVANKEVPEDVAKKQIQSEVQNNPALKKLSDQYDSEIEGIRKKGREMRADYLTKGLQADVDPNMVVYPSGKIGVKGMGENEASFKMDQFNDLISKTAAETLHNQSIALGHEANERAQHQGAFFGSMRQSANEMSGAFYKWFFDKTGWGGDQMRMFQGDALSQIPVTESDQAKAWNWQGAKSLLKPEFYASKVGAMIPVIAPSAAVTALTEGVAAPEAVTWLASAGVFTFQDALSFRNGLINATDKYGNKLTDFDADEAAATQAREEFLPNVALMALNIGALGRAKGITKPTLGKAAKDAVIGSVAGTIPMAVQGYLSHANELLAKGQKPDLWDYMQDDHFATSLVDGLIGGFGIQLAHAPTNYMSQIRNWKHIIANSEGEFRDNSLYNAGLQHEINGGGNYLRDALKMHIMNDDLPAGQKEELSQLLQYSTALERNVKGANIDISSVDGAYQAHNLALADLHDQWAEQNKNNKNLSKIYADQAKDFRDEAKKVMEGKAKYHYLIDKNDDPIFISDQSFKHLDKEGVMGNWISDGTIKDIRSSEDPNFSNEYRQSLKDRAPEAAEPFKPVMESEDHEKIVQVLKDNRNQFTPAGEKWIGPHLDNPKSKPEEIAEAIISQAMDHGHQQNVQEMIGPEAFKAIKPFIEEQKALRKEGNVEAEKTEVAPAPEEKPVNENEYKPNIRDDYFAKADFFTPEEKEQYSQLDDAGKDKMIDEKRSKLKAEKEKPESRISLNEVTDKPVLYNGEKATIYKDGQTLVAKIEGKNKEYELGNVDEIGNESIKDYGIEQQATVVNADDEGDVTVRGQKYKNNYSDPLAAINRDENGNVVSVNLETPDGKKRTFRGDIAEDVAYQIHLKELNKDNATKTEFEDFLNEDPETRQEIENVGLREVAEEKPVEDHGKVSREPAKVKPEKKEPVKKKVVPEPVKEPEPLTPEQQHIADLKASAERLESEGDTSPELKTMKDRIADLENPPPPPAEPVRPTAEQPKEEFTAVRKEKQEEIAGAKELFDRQKKVKWSDTYDSALHNVQSMYPGKNLYDAMKARVDYFMTKLENKELYNPTSEDIAVFNVYKDQTMRKMAQITGFDSADEIHRQNASREFSSLQNELLNVVRVNNPEGEAGRAFNLLQSEVSNSEEHGLQIRRMELQGAKGGGKLSDADLQYTADQWEKEKALIARENELKEKALTEKFEKAIAKLKEEKAPPTVKEKREKLLSEKGKELADKIRSGKLTGTYATFPGVPQAINLVIEGIAQLVEGGATLAEAISNYAKANNIKDEEKFKDNFFGVMGKYEKKAQAFDSIEKLATAGATSVNNKMVSKNLIRDYVNSHAGLHDTKDILDAAYTDLKKILPDLEKNKLVEAYLKTGDFKQPTKVQLERGFKESERNLNKLASIEKDINDLNNKNDIFKKTSNKTSPYDKDVQAKEKERNDIMTKMGIKTSGEDKYTKASYDQRAVAHNDRLDGISKMIDQKLLDPDLSENAVKQLTNLKGKIDASKIKLDPNSALSQERTLQGGSDILKAVKSEFSRNIQGDILKAGDINRELQRTIDKFNTDKQDFTQNVKLQRAKDKARREIDDFKRKIAASEYEDNPIIDLTKADAELLKIKRDRDLIADDFYNKKHEYQKANEPWWKKVGSLGRAVWVADLIGKPFTLAKVAASATLRPFLETVTKLTVSKVFEALPFRTTKAIVERAKAGGESSSIRAAQKGYEAYLRQYSPEQLKERYQKASDNYEKAESEYFKVKDDPAANPKEVQALKDKKNDALINALGQSVYQYIGGSSIKESMEVLIHRSTELERELGHFDREAWKKGTGGLKDIDNIEYLLNFVGRSHAALKNFSARYSFASGFMARLESAVKSGDFVANPDKILEIAHQSYIDWDRGKYQEPNWISDTWNKITNAVDKVSPQFAYLLKFDVAITRVPVNMLREGIMEYTLGAFRGSVMAAREYYKSKGMVLQDGYTPESEAQFKTELNEQLQKIDPDTAATIMRSFRKGGFGLGLYALALLGKGAFGGWAHKGQTNENKAKKKREEQTGVPEVMVGQIKIGNWTLPEPIAKIAEHTPAFAPLGYGLGLAQVYQNNIEDGKSTPEAATNAAMAQVNHILGSIPQIDKVVRPLVTDVGGSFLPNGQWDDVDQQGNPMKREAFRMDDYLNYIPGTNKKEVLSEHYYKEAVKNQKFYREQITRAETNTSLSEKEKSDLRTQYLKQLKESTDEIYRLNKEKPQ